MSSAPDPPFEVRDLEEIDLLRVVYLLVLDGQGPPDLLTHLGPERIREVIVQFSERSIEFRNDRRYFLAEIQDRLFKKYPDTYPHPLWRAWMENTQRAAVERLQAELLGNVPS